MFLIFFYGNCVLFAFIGESKNCSSFPTRSDGTAIVSLQCCFLTLWVYERQGHTILVSVFEPH